MTKDKVEKYVGSWKQVKAENMDAVRVIFSSNDDELNLNLLGFRSNWNGMDIQKGSRVNEC